jgi:hypothetical protein
MIRAKPVLSSTELTHFFKIRSEIYKRIEQDRGGSEELARLLLSEDNNFKTHARILPFLLQKDEEIIGRFVLIHDRYLSNYVQVAFFEARKINESLLDAIGACVRDSFPEVPQTLIGLSGHLNNGAGILLNHFDKPPLYEFHYNPPYYHDFFSGLKEKRLYSFVLSFTEIYTSAFFKTPRRPITGYTIRPMDKNRFQAEIGLYTALNNSFFAKHPYWSYRPAADDYEALAGFAPFLQPENLLFAEKNGETIGFLLWFPDFNEWLSGEEGLGTKHLEKIKNKTSTYTIRYMEIGVDPRYRNGQTTLALLFAFFDILKRYSFQVLEGGFILEENSESINMALRYFKRITGREPEPYRRWAVYEYDHQEKPICF